MEFKEIGKICNTHGIKGELRILSDFEYKDKVFKKGINIYIGQNHCHEVINTYRHHKQYDMITLSGYNNINEVLKYMKKNGCCARAEVESISWLESELVDSLTQKYLMYYRKYT